MIPRRTATSPSVPGGGCRHRCDRAMHGLWLPETPEQTEPGQYSHGMHSGVGGLAHVLAEIRLTRDLDPRGGTSARGRHRRDAGEPHPRRRPSSTTSTGSSARSASASPWTSRAPTSPSPGCTSWPPLTAGSRRGSGRRERVADGRCNDATLGPAACSSAPSGPSGTTSRARPTWPRTQPTCSWRRASTGRRALDWLFVPRRFLLEARVGEMPNWSHGLAGIAGALPLAGHGPASPGDLVEAAGRRGAPASPSPTPATAGCASPRHPRDKEGLDTYTYTWCHGPAGTSLLFAALARAGIDEVGARTP